MRGQIGVVDILDLVERIAIGEFQRGADRDLRIDQGGEQPMFIENGLATPPAGSIEFRHHMLSVVEADIVDTIFEGIQREAMTRGIRRSAASTACSTRVGDKRKKNSVFSSDGDSWPVAYPAREFARTRTVSLEFSRT